MTVPFATGSGGGTSSTHPTVDPGEQERKLACFRDNGFEGELDDDLGISTKVPPEQQDRFFEVNRTCREAVAEKLGLQFGLPSEEVLRRTYRMYLYIRQCMVQTGYPTDEPPSMERFVESGGSLWHPYNAFMGTAAGATGLSDLEQLCPQDLPYLESVLEFDD